MFLSFFSSSSLLDVWTLEPGMSESFVLVFFHKMSCIAFACVDRFLYPPSCASFYTFFGPNTRIDTTFSNQCLQYTIDDRSGIAKSLVINALDCTTYDIMSIYIYEKITMLFL
jgi:hypothetical protein